MTPGDEELRPPATVHRGGADGWVDCACGNRHWGLVGAAGVLVWRAVPSDGPGDGPGEGPDAPRIEVVLQHRAWWSHHGGTWGLPGGALDVGEDPISGALREAREEVGVGAREVTVRASRALRHEDWSYTTVLAEARRGVTPRVCDPESLAVEWVDVRRIDAALAAGEDPAPDPRPPGATPEERLAAGRRRRDDLTGRFVLLPAFARTWPELRRMLRRLVLVVDAANTVGARPDGWWKDRRGATERLAGDLVRVSANGLAASSVGLPGERWFPHVRLVTEGAAAGAHVPAGALGSRGRGTFGARSSTAAAVPPVEIRHAGGHGDDAIAAEAARQAADPLTTVVVVTSDRELRGRVQRAGASVAGPSLVLPT